MARIVSFINWKGGVGKTTLSYHVGLGLSKFHKKKILLVDLDPQANLSFLALGGAEKYAQAIHTEKGASLHDLYERYFSSKPFDTETLLHKKKTVASEGRVYSDVDLILSHQNLILVDLKLAKEKRAANGHEEETKNELKKMSILSDALAEVRSVYDYIILDCPPNMNITTQNALFASDSFVIPAKADVLSTVGISIIRDQMAKFNHSHSHMWKLIEEDHVFAGAEFRGVIFNEITERDGQPKSVQQQVIASLKKGTDVFENYLTDGGGITDAAMRNVPVYSLTTENALKQSAHLQKIVDEFVSRIPSRSEP